MRLPHERLLSSSSPRSVFNGVLVDGNALVGDRLEALRLARVVEDDLGRARAVAAGQRQAHGGLGGVADNVAT